MDSSAMRLERRAAQRFGMNVPVHVRKGDLHATGFSQDLSLRGLFFFTEVAVQVGDVLQVTLRMPAEATLSEPMGVRCQASVVRVTPQPGSHRFGVAVRLTQHEYSDAAYDLLVPVAHSETSDPQPGIHGAD